MQSLRRYRSKRPGTGTARQGAPNSEMRQIAINFPSDLFSAIRNRAVADRTSFSEQVRLLTEWQLETLEMEPGE